MWKTVVLLFLSVAAQISAELLTLKSAWKIHEQTYDRFKRQANSYQQGNSENSIDDLLCPLQCMGLAINAAMDSINGQQFDQFRNPGQFFTQADQERFRNVCRTYQDMKNCWRPCPESFVTQMARSTYETMDYVCGPNFEDWNRYMPCYIEVGRQAGANCSDRCDNITQTVFMQQLGNIGLGRQNNQYQNNQYGQQQNQGPTVRDIFSGFLDSSCQYIQCTTDCERPLIEQRCGQRAARLLEGLVSVSMSSMQQLVNTGRGSYNYNSFTGNNNNVFPNNNNNNNNNFGFQNIFNAPGNTIPYSCNRLIQQYRPGGLL